MTYIATARVPKDDEAPLQQSLVSALPNITAIKVGDVLKNIATLLNGLAWAIQGMALLCIVNGTVVMIAALAITRYRRTFEAAMIKVLGGTRTLIVQTLALELGLIGGLAGLVGGGLACGVSWVISRVFLDLTWIFSPDLLGTSLLLTIGLTLVIGFFSTYRILGQPPLAVLREE